MPFVLKRRNFFAASLAALASTTASGATSDAAAPVRDLVDCLLRIMKSGQHTPFQSRFDTLAPVVDRTFDLSAILQESVGPSWVSLPADQQSKLESAFRRYTVASYVDSFDSFDDQRFDVKPDTRPVGNGEQVVQTRIVPRSGGGHELDYVMRSTPSGWRVVDVLADGAVSRVAVQRSDFRRLLARGGPDALEEALRTKSADMSDAG